MKEYFMLIGVIISICFQTFASKEEVFMETHKLDLGTKGSTVRRSPALPPFKVFYDDEVRKIEVYGSEELNAQIFLCDESGNILDYSTSINAVLRACF